MLYKILKILLIDAFTVDPMLGAPCRNRLLDLPEEILLQILGHTLSDQLLEPDALLTPEAYRIDIGEHKIRDYLAWRRGTRVTPDFHRVATEAFNDTYMHGIITFPHQSRTAGPRSWISYCSGVSLIHPKDDYHKIRRLRVNVDALWREDINWTAKDITEILAPYSRLREVDIVVTAHQEYLRNPQAQLDCIRADIDLWRVQVPYGRGKATVKIVQLSEEDAAVRSAWLQPRRKPLRTLAKAVRRWFR
ncbi:hypothetical protein LTR56_015907 [Elasticomyces elasticus]|nr:hypothetical protein LTR56_015907 [Elasticomyces elasticus]KAK3655336.1 hypothetical protein LTR22_010366 [Elasticomyces elasticus]KAK4918692.1 hypothetical protein LTR49_013617 [Elasticomyces elasticus]KAK5744063.1 hypothetical protein LTS12_023633 [Elasticomyces elasticus]